MKPQVFRCIGDGFRASWRFARARPGLFAYLVLVALVERLIGKHASSELSVALLGAVIMPFQAPPLVTLHRSILLGEERGPLLPSRLLRYALVSVGLLLFVLVPAGFGHAALTTGAGSGAATVAGIGAVAGIVVSVRASLALPHAAIDGERPLRASLDLIRGSAWRVFAVTLLPMLLLLVPLGLSQAAAGLPTFVVDLLGAVFSAASVAVAAAALTYAYRVLSQGVDAPL
jgi:hypothetical protein